ncbi:type VI secretion system contractile sheath large subunit [Thiohalorhabdus methylotrophus]|uniref:Type VI secretion system contractile sheath large subunit n=1 Tax=Thiohalorhabdus methylotrophus TaxID=3242694 RepID=A0ABV4TSK0_9GAMM
MAEGTDTAEMPLVGQILDQTRFAPDEEGYQLAREGVQALLLRLLGGEVEEERVDKRVLDEMIDELDRRLGAQMDEILHHPDFQEMESTWRGLRFLVDRTDFKENIRIEVMNASKQDLLEDFEEAGENTSSGLYRHAYTNGFGQFGGEPVGVMVGDYSFTPAGADIRLLQELGSLGTMLHAPFIGNAGEEFFRLESFEELPQLKDLESIFEGPRYAKWNTLRNSPDANNIGLTLPRFMLRTPYGEDSPIRRFNYSEATEGHNENYLWGSASYAFATRVTESFANYRWCPNIIGPTSGGAMKDMPVDTVVKEGQELLFGPVEVPISDRQEFELSELGFIPLTLRKGSDNAAFFSANSVQKPKYFGADEESKQAELNYRLGTQLPYLFIVSRLAHYLKVLQRENLGSWKGRAELENELNRWLRQYVADQENPAPATRSQRPLRRANIKVDEVAGEGGWYKVSMDVTPHFKFMGVNFTLSLSGMLERV